jgi:spermidine/putrescine ABC transporter ATP-binding subunit
VSVPAALSGRGASIRLDGLCKVFADAVAVADLSLEVGAGEFLTLLGPSGSGKSTTLLMIAGFLVPTRGDVFIGGVPVTRKPPHERDIGVVFQSYALFPHLTVFENVAFALKMRKLPAAHIAERVARALELIRLEGLGGRYPHQLSGGQQQRVALARALVFEPSLLLMDEPLGALDRKLRETMQLELKRLQRTLALTVIYVTHDQEEALTMSDRIAVMNRGRIEQVASPEELYERPRTPFVADFLGESNSLGGSVVRANGSQLVVRTSRGLEVVASRGGELSAGREVRLAIRPGQIVLLGPGDASDNVVEAVIEEVVYLGDALRCLVRSAQGELLCVKMQCPRGEGAPRAGQAVRLGWQADAVIVHEAER